MVKEDVQKHIKYCLYAMKMLRIHPEIPRNYRWFLEYCFSYGALMTYLPFIIWSTYIGIQNKDFIAACQAGIFCFSFFGSSINNFIILFYRTQIGNLLNMMKNDYVLMKEMQVEDQMIFQKYMKKEHFLCKQWLLITIFAMGLFNAKAVLSTLYYYIIGEMRLVYMHDIIFTDYIEARKQEIFVYICINSMIMYCGCYVCVNNLSFVPLCPILMLHACGHLEVIKRHIDDLFEGDSVDVNETLNAIVKKLQYTYYFVELANQPFRLFYDATLNLSSVMLPVTFYALLQSLSRGELSMEFSSFILSGVLMSSTPSYYSDLLLEKGEEVSMALYSCGWERTFDRRIRSTILTLLIRSTRTIALRTMFKTLCLETLTDVFKQAYTIFNLMNAVIV